MRNNFYRVLNYNSTYVEIQKHEVHKEATEFLKAFMSLCAFLCELRAIGSRAHLQVSIR